MPSVKTKRVYDESAEDDGYRVLVDRLWPRGVSKTKAKVDLWFREVAPSDSLRKWFGHDPGKWQEFLMKYRKELAQSGDFEKLVSIVSEKRRVTLLYSARDTKHNQAVALKLFLEERGVG